MAQPLIKFFRVAALPTGAGVPGALYFVHDSSLGEGKGKLYICTAEGVFEDYTGLHSYENTNTTYDLKSVVNELKGQIQLVGSDESVDNLYIEGGNNIKVSSTADGVKVEHTTPTEGTALVAEDTEKAPGYAGTFTAVTGLKKDANGHIVEATLETIKLPEKQDLSNYKTKQEAVADVAASGTASTVVTSVTQNANGEITVTKANLPAESADVDSLDGKTGAITTLKGQTATGSINLEVDANNQLKATLVGSFDNGAQVNKVDGVIVNGTDVVGEDKIARITAIEGVATGDKILSKNGNNVMSTLSMSYDDKAKKIYLKGIEDKVISEVDATGFIKDGMVDSASIVWCTSDAEGKHTVVDANAEGAIRCLQIVFNTDAGKEAIHIPLNELTDVYTGADKQIVVSESNVIGLAEHKAKADTGKALTPAHGGSFNVITGVTTDDYGRVNSVETSQVTLPTIADGDKTGSDDYVSVQVKTAAGAVSEVIVNTDALSEKISGIETEISDNALVTASALNDLNSRLTTAEGTLASGVGVMSVIGEDPYKFDSLPAEDQALVQAHDDFVWTEATTDDEGNVTLDSQVVVMKSTKPAKGLATDAYVNERIAAEKVSVTSSSKTLDVTHDGNNYNVELAWQMF